MNQRLIRGEYYGFARQRLAAGPVMVSETLYGADAVVPLHEHEAAYLCFVLAGSFSETCVSGSERHASTGSLVLHPEGDRHRNRFGSVGGACLNLEITRSLAARLREGGLLLERAHATASVECSTLARRIHAELRQSDAMAPIVIEGLTITLIATATRLRDRAGHPLWLKRTLEYLHSHFREPATIESLASLAGVHPVHFARSFRRQVGQTPGEHIRSLRLQAAAQQLCDRSDSISRIAAEAGFADQSHFTRAFRGRFGCTPRVFRREHAKSRPER